MRTRRFRKKGIVRTCSAIGLSLSSGTMRRPDGRSCSSLHFNAPHWPWEAPGDQAEAERLRGRDLIHWDGGSQETYRRIIAAMDMQIGRVLAALEENGINRDTIVIFTSDNGGERFSDTWPFTGKKMELLEGGLRIPAIMSWPARIAAGRVSEQVTVNMDWLPTLLAAAGVDADPGYPPDGMNLRPHLAQGCRSWSVRCSGVTSRCGSERLALEMET